MFNRYDQVPLHIRATHSPEQRAYYEAVYAEPRFGPEWSTAHRRLEMTVADSTRRDFFLGYWPYEALHTLESFRRQHFDAPPDKGTHAQSSVGDRLRHYYPGLFPMLDRRMAALSDAAGTHPWLRPLWKRYENLKALFWRKLQAAEIMAEGVESKPRRRELRHQLYREAFAAVYPRLRELLDELDAGTHRE